MALLPFYIQGWFQQFILLTTAQKELYHQIQWEIKEIPVTFVQLFGDHYEVFVADIRRKAPWIPFRVCTFMDRSKMFIYDTF